MADIGLDAVDECGDGARRKSCEAPKGEEVSISAFFRSR